MSILIVEDNPEDYDACVYALRKYTNRPITHCADGDEALHYLRSVAAMETSNPDALPDLILLDLNLPAMDGREVLNEIKKHESLRKIPVVILTTSSSPRDVNYCYTNGANSYVVKPVNLTQFVASIGDMVKYWYSTVKLPIYRELFN